MLYDEINLLILLKKTIMLLLNSLKGTFFSISHLTWWRCMFFTLVVLLRSVMQTWMYITIKLLEAK